MASLTSRWTPWTSIEPEPGRAPPIPIRRRRERVRIGPTSAHGGSPCVIGNASRRSSGDHLLSSGGWMAPFPTPTADPGSRCLVHRCSARPDHRYRGLPIRATPTRTERRDRTSSPRRSPARIDRRISGWPATAPTDRGGPVVSACALAHIVAIVGDVLARQGMTPATQHPVLGMPRCRPARPLRAGLAPKPGASYGASWTLGPSTRRRPRPPPRSLSSSSSPPGVTGADPIMLSQPKHRTAYTSNEGGSPCRGRS
jgi:hypothetical protein